MYQRGGKDLSCIGIIVDNENPNAPEIRRARGSSLRHSVTRVPDLFTIVEERRQPPDEPLIQESVAAREDRWKGSAVVR